MSVNGIHLYSKNLRKFVIIQINRSGVKSKEYVLPMAKDKAGGYTCKVTVGGVASSYSASSTITTTGLSLGILYGIGYTYCLMMLYT